MFSKLTIDNYRGIRHAEIDGLTQVNIFFGKNNCGKSSVLEAVFLLCGQSNPMITFTANRFRGLRLFTKQGIEMEFYGCLPENVINIKADGQMPRQLTIEMFEENNLNVDIKDKREKPIAALEKDYGVRHSFRINDFPITFRAEMRLNPDDDEQAKANTDERYKERIYCKYLSSRHQNDTEFTSYDKVVEHKAEASFFEVLRIVEPRLVDLASNGKLLMADVGYNRRIPVKSLGDGFCKILSIILSIYECENGVLIIDEIENGLHHSVIEKCWNVFLKMAKENNVKLFISTHSLELLRGLASTLEDEAYTEYKQEVSAYKLIRMDDDELAALRYDSKKLTYCLEQEIEIR